jgi:hypothetical protein
MSSKEQEIDIYGKEWLVSCVEIFQTLIPLIALLQKPCKALNE